MRKKLAMSAGLAIMFTSIFFSLRIGSKSGNYQKMVENEAKIREVMRGLDQVYQENYLKIEKKDLNKLYSFNKKALDVLKKNYLEEELLQLKDFVLKNERRNGPEHRLKPAMVEIGVMLEDLKDKTIREKFIHAQGAISEAQKIEDPEKMFSAIQDINGEIENMKSQLIELGKVKPENSRVLSGFNKVLVYLDQTQLMLAPWIKAQALNRQMQKKIAILKRDLVDQGTRYNRQSQETAKSLVWPGIVSILVLGGVLTAMVVLKGGKVSEMKKSNAAPENPRAENGHDQKLILNIMAEYSESISVVIDKEGKIAWAMKRFTGLCGKVDYWNQAIKGQFTEKDGRWLHHASKQSMRLTTQTLSSLKFSCLHEFVPVPLVEQAIQEVYAHQGLTSSEMKREMERPLLTEVQEALDDLQMQLNPLIHVANLKLHMDAIDVNFVKIPSSKLIHCLKEVIESFMVYTQAYKLSGNIHLSMEKKDSFIKTTLFFEGTKFDRVNHALTVGTKVYPSLSSKLRKIETDFALWKTHVTLKNIFRGDKTFKGGVMIIEMLDKGHDTQMPMSARLNSSTARSSQMIS